MTFVAEYVKDGKLIRVYSEHGKKIVTELPLSKQEPKVLNGYIPRKKCVKK